MKRESVLALACVLAIGGGVCALSIRAAAQKGGGPFPVFDRLTFSHREETDLRGLPPGA